MDGALESRRMKVLLQDAPDDAKKIIKRLTSLGHEAYLVGGGVRDRLIGRIVSDWDITTNAHPQQVVKRLPGS